MAKRRVFRTRATCPGINADLAPVCNQHKMIGQHVALEKSLRSEVNIVLDGVAVGHLDAAVQNQVASAIDRGQTFTAVIEKAFPIYTGRFKQSGAYIDIKIEYLLEKGQPAIEAPTCWRCIDSPDS